MNDPTETRHRAAEALARALAQRGRDLQVLHDYGLSIIVPAADASPWWPIWVTSYATRWRYGPDAADIEVWPHGTDVAELAERVEATMPEQTP